MTLIAQMGALLLQGATTAGSAIVTPVGSGPSWYVLFTQITTAAAVVLCLLLIFILFPALGTFRKTS
jgi:hypothetical protein